jgi:thiamine biosynthesis protein ThiS
MRAMVNGEAYELKQDDHSLLGLLRELGVSPEHVAVLVNDEVVTGEARRTRTVLTDDRVEILTFAGGG